jgi:hypothetical protein
MIKVELEKVITHIIQAIKSVERECGNNYTPVRLINEIYDLAEKSGLITSTCETCYHYTQDFIYQPCAQCSNRWESKWQE